MNYIEEFCDDILILKNGEIMISGNIKKIKQSYQRDKLLISSKDEKQILDTFPEQAEKDNFGNIILHLKKPEDKQKMMQKLIKEYDIDSIGIMEPTLNDIFVEYAGDEKEIAEIKQSEGNERA